MPKNSSSSRFLPAAGATYDFQFQPDTSGEISFQVKNVLNKAEIAGKMVVR